MKRVLLFGFSLFSLTVLTGCQKSFEDQIMEERPVKELYDMGMEKLEKKNYKKAARIFDEVDRQHPYSKWAPKAILMSAYSYYMDQKYDQAIAQLETFIQLNPGFSEADYAYYLLALCYYEQIRYVRRDPQMARFARTSFQALINRFPKSKYVKDAKLKLQYTKDHLAGKEMSVGRYYLKMGAYAAALGRFKTVVTEFSTTDHVQEALHRLVETYLALGLKKEAQATAAVLGHNYPESLWYKDSYYLLTKEDLRPEHSKHTASWLNKLLGKRLEG